MIELQWIELVANTRNEEVAGTGHAEYGKWCLTPLMRKMVSDPINDMRRYPTCSGISSLAPLAFDPKRARLFRTISSFGLALIKINGVNLSCPTFLRNIDPGPLCSLSVSPIAVVLLWF